MSTRDLFNLSGQVAVVVGASEGGLGAPAARALADLGAHVHVVDLERTREAVEATVATITASGGSAEPGTCDVTDEESVQAMVRQVVASSGHVDVLLDNAGAMLRKSVLETTREEWDLVLHTNVTGAFLLAKAVVPHMPAGGRIVTVGSVYTDIVGRLPEAAYYAAKAAVSNLSRGLAMELAGRGITVNCIAPGVFYPTRMTAPLGDDPDRLRLMTERTMLGRLGDPRADLQGVVAFLASRASAYVTGQTLFVDGGWSSW